MLKAWGFKSITCWDAKEQIEEIINDIYSA
jgi:hypothetical protein